MSTRTGKEFVRPSGALPKKTQKVLASRGRPLESSTRTFMESRFGHDFSGVRVHADEGAAESARDLRAAAYTVGPHIVFGGGLYAPATEPGKRLLAHELTHTVQQRGQTGGAPSGSLLSDHRGAAEREADRVGERVFHGAPAGPVTASPAGAIHRADIVTFFQSLFSSDNFSEETLQSYLTFLDEGRIEGLPDSDNKARKIVEAWKKGGSPYYLTGGRKAVMIKEMLDGPTTGPDEEAILEILERSDNDDLDAIFDRFGSPSQEQVASDVPDDPESQLADFCRRRWVGGIEAFRKGDGYPKPDGVPVPFGRSLPKPQPPFEEEPKRKVTRITSSSPAPTPARPAPSESVSPPSPFGPEKPYPGKGSDVLGPFLATAEGQKLKAQVERELKRVWDQTSVGEKVALLISMLATAGIAIYGATQLSSSQQQGLLNMFTEDKDTDLQRPLDKKVFNLPITIEW